MVRPGDRLSGVTVHIMRDGAAPGRRVILLTVFPKTRRSETAEVARAVQAQKIGEAEHGTAHQVSGREVNRYDRTALLL